MPLDPSFNKKKAVLQIAFLILAALALIFFQYLLQNSQTKSKKTRIVRIYDFPVSEFSGMDGLRSSGELKIYGIGDNNLVLGSMLFDKDFKVKNYDTNDLSQSILSRFSICNSDNTPSCRKFNKNITSQIESLIQDSNQFYMLQEHTGAIFIIDKLSQALKGIVRLNIFPYLRNLKDLPKVVEENSLGEGFVLLSNGHVLMLKEKSPAGIIEFGPQNATPEGFNSSLIIGNGQGFMEKQADISEGKAVDLYPLFYWKIKIGKESGCDLSGSSLKANGPLYLLSQKCRLIGSIDSFAPKAKLKIKKTWSIPKEINNPEAIYAVDNKTFFIADDKKSTKNNLFLVEAIKD